MAILAHSSRSLCSLSSLFLVLLIVCTIELSIISTWGMKQVIIEKFMCLCVFFLLFCRNNIETQLGPRNLKGDVNFSYLQDREARVLLIYISMQDFWIWTYNDAWYASFTLTKFMSRNFIHEPKHRKRRSNFFVNKLLLHVWRYSSSSKAF